jgi:hypothetical protein
MKLLLSLSLILCFVTVCFPQDRSRGPSVKLPRLRQELLKRVNEDQRIRDQLIKKGIDHPDPTLLQEMNKIDAIKHRSTHSYHQAAWLARAQTDRTRWH